MTLYRVLYSVRFDCRFAKMVDPKKKALLKSITGYSLFVFLIFQPSFLFRQYVFFPVFFFVCVFLKVIYSKNTDLVILLAEYLSSIWHGTFM